jgi:cytochrome P450
MSRNLLTLDPPDHTRLRRLVQPSFTGRTIAAMDARVRVIANDLLDAAEREAAERGESAPDRTMELVRQFAYPLPVAVISDLVGIPVEDRARARHWTENLLKVDRADPETQADIQQRLQEFADYLKDLFEKRRREPREDLISELVRAEEDGDTLSPDELLSMVFIVYVAGFVTTVNLIGNVTVGLLSHPDQVAAYRADPSLARNAVEETLRYWGPAESTLPRIAMEDVEIGGMTIRRGERMRAGLAAMDRDPAKFANPEVFDITRPDANRHVAFGKGVHVCLGAPLARLEGEIAVQTLFGRYPELRLAVPAAEVRWSQDLLRGFERIPLLF